MVRRDSILGAAYGMWCFECKSICVSGNRRCWQHELIRRSVLYASALFHQRKGFKTQYQSRFDIFTICMIFTVMCARINCIVSGCCAGLVIPGTHVHFPTRELEILYYIVMLILLIPRVKKSKNPGSIYPLYMASYGAFRFIDEFFRTSSTGMLFHLSHVWAAIAFAAGLSIYIEINARNHQRKKVIKK